MNKNVLVLAAALLAVIAVCGLASAAEQVACPVTGEKIDKATSPHLDWQGQRIYFSSADCQKKFTADPEKYFAKLAADGVELENIQTTCPVSGEQLTGGDMGDPVKLSYKGRTVMLCCNMCKPKFEKDPAKYLAKLPGAQPAETK